MSLKKQVLNCFRKLHKTRKYIFGGDIQALQFVRDRINSEFIKNKNINDQKAIEDLIRLAIDVEHELKTTVIQAKEIKPGVHAVRINPETVMSDNMPYNEELVQLNTGSVQRIKCCKEFEKNEKS